MNEKVNTGKNLVEIECTRLDGDLADGDLPPNLNFSPGYKLSSVFNSNNSMTNADHPTAKVTRIQNNEQQLSQRPQRPQPERKG